MFSEISMRALNDGDFLVFSKIFYINTQLKQKTKTVIEIHYLIIWVSAQIVHSKRSFPLTTDIKLCLISLDTLANVCKIMYFFYLFIFSTKLEVS